MMYYVHILSSYVFYFQSYSLMDSDKGLSESFSAKPLLSAIINMPVAEMIWVSVLYTFFNKPDVILLSFSNIIFLTPWRVSTQTRSKLFKTQIFELCHHGFGKSPVYVLYFTSIILTSNILVFYASSFTTTCSKPLLASIVTCTTKSLSLPVVTPLVPCPLCDKSAGTSRTSTYSSSGIFLDRLLCLLLLKRRNTLADLEGSPDTGSRLIRTVGRPLRIWSLGWVVVATVSGMFSSMDVESDCRVNLQKQMNVQILERASLKGGNMEQ